MEKMNITEFKKLLKEEGSAIISYRKSGGMFDQPIKYLLSHKHFQKSIYRFLYHNGLIMYVDLIPKRKIKSDYWED